METLIGPSCGDGTVDYEFNEECDDDTASCNQSTCLCADGYMAGFDENDNYACIPEIVFTNYICDET